MVCVICSYVCLVCVNTVYDMCICMCLMCMWYIYIYGMCSLCVMCVVLYICICGEYVYVCVMSVSSVYVNVYVRVWLCVGGASGMRHTRIKTAIRKELSGSGIKVQDKQALVGSISSSREGRSK